MKFTVKCFRKDGEVLSFLELDKDICNLWHVPFHEKNWATPPSCPYTQNWHEFIFILICFSMPESGVATVDHLIWFYIDNNSPLDSKFLEWVKEEIYFISLLLYLKKREVFFTIQYE